MVAPARLLLCLLGIASALRVPSGAPGRVSRREALGLSAAGVALAIAPLPALAVDPKDNTRLVKGLEGVQYLLDNWAVETVDPVSGVDSPDRVRFFLGLRTTDHPLFQVDKLLINAQKDLPDDVDFETWIDSVEGLNSHIAKINELAYTSSFGEYNPGGGKEQVRKYLLLCKVRRARMDRQGQQRRSSAARRCSPPL